MAVKIFIKRRVTGKESIELSLLLQKLRGMTLNQPGYISGETLRRIDRNDEWMVISTWRSVEDWNKWVNNDRRRVVQAEIAVMGARGAVEVLYGRQARKAENAVEFLADKEKEYQNTVANPYVAAQRGYIDDIIEPSVTRSRIIRALGLLQNKRDSNPMKKHGNIPL